MTAESMHCARAGVPSRPSVSSSRTWAARLLPALAAACALAACGDDDSKLSQTDDTPHAPLSAAPLAQAVTAPAASVETPARPLVQTDATASAEAAATLAPPVIHTVD